MKAGIGENERDFLFLSSEWLPESMNKERSVDELVDHAKKLGAVSVEAGQVQNLLRELKWDGRKLPNENRESRKPCATGEGC